MAIPAYDALYKSILEVLSDGNVHNSKETIEHCAEVFKLTDEEKTELLQSGRQSVLANRVGWARTYLKKAGLISTPSRGHYQITTEGRKALAIPDQVIDNDYLSRYKGFQDFVKITETDDSGKTDQNPVVDEVKTPQEIMDAAYKGITEQLADDLMTNIMDQSPSFFEKLVIDLLTKMGYGSKLENPGEVTGKTGDEGIDGIVREDALGFDRIFVQAKRWSPDHTVGEPDIQQFVGALAGKGATKGLYITTSHFSAQAKAFVEKYALTTTKIVLIDGETLTKLMIRYGLGVSTVHEYKIKRVDSDYFDIDEE